MIQDVATIATAVGVFVAVLELRVSARQRVHQFEAFNAERWRSNYTWYRS